MNRFWQILILSACLSPWACALDPGSFAEENHARMEILFSSLDENGPDVSSMRTMWQKGDHKDALQAALSHFRKRSFDLSLVEPAHIPKDFLQQADEALDNRFLIHGEWFSVPVTGPAGLDWEFRGPAGDKEIAWMLNRHTILPILAEACRKTGDAIYRKRLNGILVDWIAASPYPGRMTFSPQWRALEAARRVLNSWIHIFYDYNDLLDDETLLLMLSSLPEHADALHSHASFWGGNHLLTEKTALLALATAWPEYSGSAEWIDDAIESTSGQIMKQSYPDGSHTELSNHYQRVVINNTLPFLKLLRQQTGNAGDAAIDSRIEAMWNYFAYAMKPDGSGPVNNASDQEQNDHFIESAWQQFGRRDWLGIATNGREGVLPGGSPSRVFPWAGHVFMRSDWGPTAQYVYLDAGPFGTAHQHVDKLHLSITLNGENLLVDSGRYTYQPGKWKTYFQGPRSHSVILLDGQAADQGPRKVRQPNDIYFSEVDGATYAAATARFNPAGEWLRAPVPWTRHVLLDHRGFVIVFDHIVAFKQRDIEVLWQFAPDIEKAQASRIVMATGIEPVRQEAILGRDALPVGGFFSPDYSRLQPAVQMSNFFRIDRPTTLCHIINSPTSPRLRVESVFDSASGMLQFTVLLEDKRIAEGTLSLDDPIGLVSYTAR